LTPAGNEIQKMHRKWISLRDVSFIRRHRMILDRITWAVNPHDHWAVLGANGSGKTTLLQLLAGYLWPSQGEIVVLGERFGHTDLRELRKQIGWVGSFLQAHVPPSQRPLDFIVSGKFASIGLFEDPKEDDYRQARELAHRLGCAHILESSYRELSQGEKQRLLIARALIHQPRLMILDEPCAGLDLVAGEELLRTLDELGRAPDGPTMIFVTHHIEEVIPVFSHVLLLKQGRCLAAGEKGEVLESDLLSETYGVAMQVQRENGRYWARIAAAGVRAPAHRA
jgi:iron complex transport system ATP-binding protein